MAARSVPWVVLLLLSFHENSSRGTKYTASNSLEELFWFKTAFHVKIHGICTLASSQRTNKCFTQPKLWYECGGEEPVSPQFPTDGDMQGEAGSGKGSQPFLEDGRGACLPTLQHCCFSLSSPCLKGISLEHQKHLLSMTV